MDTKYLQLFREISHAVELMAEKVMELNHAKNDAKGEQTAKTMRDDYIKLYDKLRADDFNPNFITRAEYARLLVGTLIVVNNLQERIKNEQNAVNGYKTDIIPKLQRIIDETKEDNEAVELANTLFTILEETQVKEENK